MNEEKLIKVDFDGKNCEIQPFDGAITPVVMPGYTKMDISKAHMGEISALCQQIPTISGASIASDAYIVKWHDGVPHDLAPYKNYPGLSPVARDSNGRIEEWTELYPVKTQAALLYGFSAMALVTSQYYLAEINHKMQKLSQGIDKILEFLFGDKKAELLSEITFTKYAYQNFASIMEHDDQRIATIQSLQEGRKTAIKDIEFYLENLHNVVYGKGDSDIEGLVSKALRTQECLEYANQLYVAANVLEVYYSQNHDPAYLSYVERDMLTYISKVDKQMLETFAMLRGKVDAFNSKIPGRKIAKGPLLEKIDTVIEKMRIGEDSVLKKEVQSALHSSERPVEYCITADGSLYLKNA